ncbi:MAG: hypothetical protein ACFFBY_11545 [Promethearchaeota archaeon]
MKLNWKQFKKTYPFICVNCGEISNTEREYCEKCGLSNFRAVKKEDYEKIMKE